MSARPGHGRGRKPVDAMAAVGQLAPQEIIWQAIRSVPEFDRKTLCKVIYQQQGRSVSDSAVASYLRRLCRAGYIHLVREEPLPGSVLRKVFALAPDAPFEAPRVTKDGKPVTQGRANENMWRSMRIIGEFTARDLAVQAATEDAPISESAAKTYCMHLQKAGYLVVTRPNRGGHSPAHYRFLPSRYTGPKAPMIQRVKVVFDPNLGRVMKPEAGDAE